MSGVRSRTTRKALAQIVAGNDQILAAILLAAEHDVAVRVAGIVMIDRDPIELRAEVLFHLAHQSPGKILEVWIVDRVLGRDDESELTPVPVAPNRGSLRRPPGRSLRHMDHRAGLRG